MKIKGIKINNFLGIEEFNYNPGKFMVLEGPKGGGKSSVLEAIEIAISNKKRRTEVVRHNSGESTLFIEMDNGLEIDRRLREDKADYLKLRNKGEGIKSTESELRKFLSGDIFRPLDFISMKPREQTEIILSMIKMDYSNDEIKAWFGGEDVLSNINTDKHLLQVLKDVEVKFYNERQEVNREIKVLESQVRGIEQSLPDNYDGEEWRNKSIQEYYNKVSEAQKINHWIEEAKQLKESISNKIDSINSEKDSKLSKLDLKYKEIESDIKDIIDFSKSKIEKSKSEIEAMDNIKVYKENENKLNYQKSLDDLNREYEAKKENLRLEYFNISKNIEKDIANQIEEHKEIIKIQENKISVKESELLSLSEKKVLEIEGLEKETLQRIETEKARVGKAVTYLENNIEIDIEPLQQEAEQIEQMKEYLREWDRMLDIRDGRITTKKAYSDKLTNIIETARTKPTELLKQHKLPIDGISVDEKGLIRINGTLLDGLSDGEKLEAAFKIALQRIGELRIMCLDGFEKLNLSEQKKIVELCENEDIQTFITITKDTEDGEVKIKEEL